MHLKKGDMFIETVNSKIGYEDWVYTGNMLDSFNGKKLYAMQNERGVYWYYMDEINEMQRISNDKN